MLVGWPDVRCTVAVDTCNYCIVVCCLVYQCSSRGISSRISGIRCVLCSIILEFVVVVVVAVSQSYKR